MIISKYVISKNTPDKFPNNHDQLIDFFASRISGDYEFHGLRGCGKCMTMEEIIKQYANAELIIHNDIEGSNHKLDR